MAERMRVVRMTETGGPEVLRPAEEAVPQPGEGELLVELAGTGVNFIDVYRRTGAYPVETPYVPGTEGAGHVVAIGRCVEGFRVGDAVATAEGRRTYAEAAIVPAAAAAHVPAGVDLETAAALPLQGLTAHYLVTSVHAVADGTTLLVHAGAGGVGLLLIQLAKARGATVLTTVGGAEKAELARGAGADVVLDYEGFADRVREHTDGHGVDVVYDGVGASTSRPSAPAAPSPSSAPRAARCRPSTRRR